jgi:hypothetical protein
MLFADGAAGLLLLGLWLFCLIDAIMTDAGAVRNLPKPFWILIVLLLPEIGSLAWLIAGRPWNSVSAWSSANRAGRERPADPAVRRAYPEYDRPGRAVPANPEDDEAFLRQVRERAEAQRRAYDERRRAELEAERQRLLRKRDEDETK